MRPDKSRFQRVLYIAGILLCLVLLSIHFVSGYYARYASADRDSDSARAAAFVFKVGDGEQLDVTALTHPGCSPVVYTFAVTNNKNSRVSEVKMHYTVTAEISNCELPIRVTLTEKEGQTSVSCDLYQDSVVKPDAAVTLRDSFEAAQPGSHTYELKVEWPEERNSRDYAGKTADLTLKAEAEQVSGAEGEQP